ncbi:MAG: polysaccharide deacetylase [Cytophagaceae bacterium]|jgi:peptidoglycan/xylan/chitin deacetylase (PgdA/CDA1 family)|nr:polysaccharide deacetylase [Cytophagaceae bacterium]
MKRLFFAPFLLLFLLSFHSSPVQKEDKPKICLTFDDGSVADMPGYDSQKWNYLLLQHLRENKVQAVFFAMGKALNNEKGRQVLDRWDEDGHMIANHTYSHQSYHSAESTFENFSADVLRNDSLIKDYKGYTKLFRFPYLKEGNTEEKRDSFRVFLEKQQYRNGYVTVDASDWFINSRLIKHLKENRNPNTEAYKKFYLDHIWERANYYNELSLKLNGRQINHSLLLHHNLAAALFTDDLINMFRSKGWEVIDASEAYKDEIYKKKPNTIPAGESLIWALAKENGAYESILRYPAEDSKYEEPKMNKLGL